MNEPFEVMREVKLYQPPLEVRCFQCNADAGQPCVSRTGRRTRPHARRKSLSGIIGLFYTGFIMSYLLSDEGIQEVKDYGDAIAGSIIAAREYEP